MRFSRARYVTLCQQSLVTAAVLAVGVSAAGVTTLDIVPEPAPGVAAPGGAVPGVPQAGMQAATEVAAAPVAPTVREVAVAGISEEGPPAPLAQRGGQRLVALSDPEPVRGYATVGVTWQHGADISDRALSVQFRTERPAPGRTGCQPSTTTSTHPTAAPLSSGPAASARARTH